MVNQQHKPIIKSPFYADSNDGTMIHRFLDDDFVTRYLQRANDGELSGTRNQSWREEDRFGEAAQDYVNLRLAVHRTFYMVSAQVHCQAFAEPAFDPNRILETGMVVRKGTPDNFYTWHIQQQAALGWVKAKTIEQEPDQYKRLVQSGLIKPKDSTPLYSGEKTHPMHAQIVKAAKAESTSNAPSSQCLIYGYLPLSGSVEVKQSNMAIQLSANPMSVMAKNTNETFKQRGVFQDAGDIKVAKRAQEATRFQANANIASQHTTEGLASIRDADSNNRTNSPLYGPQALNEPQALHAPQGLQGLQALQALHEWPFGSWDGQSQGPCCDCEGSFNDLSDHPCQQYQWELQSGVLCMEHRASSAFIGLLRTLIESFHVYRLDRKASNNTANEALRSLLDRLYFYQEIDANDAGELYKSNRLQSLLSYIETNFEQLIQWFALLDQHANNPAITRAQGTHETLVINQLPGSGAALYIEEDEARQMRRLLVMRNQVARIQSVDSLPIAKFSQGKNDVYFVKPFIRYLDHCGKEKICWGPESKPFRVAAPMDPEAVRPTAIQLPELSDIKRGIAKGVSFMTPKSLADAMERISADLEFKESDKRNRFTQSLGYTISFSIPVITICAMILLTIIMKLLNIFMRWIPWAMQKIWRFR